MDLYLVPSLGQQDFWLQTDLSMIYSAPSGTLVRYWAHVCLKYFVFNVSLENLFLSLYVFGLKWSDLFLGFIGRVFLFVIFLLFVYLWWRLWFCEHLPMLFPPMLLFLWRGYPQANRLTVSCQGNCWYCCNLWIL